jgi:hypothetical protein
MNLEAAGALRAEGNALFEAGAHAAAADKYGAAADAARRELARAAQAAGGAGGAPGEDVGEDAGAAARELVLALNNRAACYLALRQPEAALADTGDAAAACLGPRPACAGRAWRCRLPSGAGWADWVRAVYAKVLLRRASAFAAAGAPLAGLPLLLWVQRSARGTPAHAAAGAAARRLAALPSDDDAAFDDDAARAAAHAATRAGRWRRVDVDLRAPAPPTRRKAAAAALDGYLYLFGGELDDRKYTPAGDFWRLSLQRSGGEGASASAPPAWERLKKPADAGGPPAALCACAHARARAAAAEPLLLLVTPEAAWSFAPQAAAPEAAWRRLMRLCSPADGSEARDLQPPSALTADGAELLVLRTVGAGALVLHSARLADGSCSVCAFAPWPGPPGAPAAPPPMMTAHAWHDGTVLRLWGGYEIAQRPAAGRAAAGEWAALATSQGQLGDPTATMSSLHELWELPMRAPGDAAAMAGWRRAPHDGGGGGPPAARSLSAAVALPPVAASSATAAPQLLLFGGRCELMPYSGDAEDDDIRFLTDVHMWSPPQPLAASPAAPPRTDGWRRVRLPPPGAPGAAARPPGGVGAACLAFDAVSRRAIVAGGCSRGDCHSLACCVYELLVDGVCGDEAPAAEHLAQSSRNAAALRALREGPFSILEGPRVMTPLPLHAFESALRAAAATPYDARATWLLSWCTMYSGGAEEGAGGAEDTDVCMLTVQARQGEPPRANATCVGQPGAPDCAWALLCATAGVAGAPPARPGTVRFAARTAAAAQRLLPLLDALGVAADLESWEEAAECALAHESDPWGGAAAGRGARCVRCGVKGGAAPGSRLRKCGACGRARYCGAACAKADWPSHKPACAVLKRGPLGRWRIGADGQPVWEPTAAARAAAQAEQRAREHNEA